MPNIRHTASCHAVIMAGGMGERFWPLTSPEKPKYALHFHGRRSLLETTYLRLRKTYPQDAIHVITVESHRGLVRSLLKALPPENVLCEPERRNTAGAVCVASLALKRKFGENLIVSFFPADAFIRREPLFLGDVRLTQECAKQTDRVALLGIKPWYPATGYGYIRCGKRLSCRGLSRVLNVNGFAEKPVAARAASYLKQGGFLWNSGIFTWRIKTFVNAMRLHAPDYFAPFEEIFSSERVNPARLRSLFHRLKAQPIDRLLIEKMSNLAVIKARFDWDDIGSWEALRRLFGDSRGNVQWADAVLDDVRDCVVILPKGRRTALSHLRDLVLVEEGRQLLLCDIRQSQRVPLLRKAAQQLHGKGAL